MKRIVLAFSVLLLVTTNSQAFPVGKYECQYGFGEMIITLKANGRATMLNVLEFDTQRGNWRDDGDTAVVITENNDITKEGNKYIFNGRYPCKKVK